MRMHKVELMKKESKGGIHYIERLVKGAFKNTGRTELVASVVVDEQAAALYIPEGISLIEINRILEKTSVPCRISDVKAQDIIVTQSQQVYPADYGQLRGQAKSLYTEVSRLEGLASGLEQSLAAERTRASALQAQVGELKAKYGAREVPDLLTEIMLRENSSWESSVRAYHETLEIAKDLTGMPLEVLERECLDYKGLEEREDFHKIAADFREAQKDESLLAKHPRLKLDDYAKSVLEKGKRIIERDKQIKEARDSLVSCFAGRKMRLVATVENRDTLLTLPFKFKEKYTGLEQGLIDAIGASLTSENVTYSQEEFNGLLRYRMPGLKTRARNRLAKAIQDCNDQFAKLCGVREMIAVGVYG